MRPSVQFGHQSVEPAKHGWGPWPTTDQTAYPDGSTAETTPDAAFNLGISQWNLQSMGEDHGQQQTRLLTPTAPLHAETTPDAAFNLGISQWNRRAWVRITTNNRPDCLPRQLHCRNHSRGTLIEANDDRINELS